jgi:hypothetical protein
MCPADGNETSTTTDPDIRDRGGIDHGIIDRKTGTL